MLHCNPINCDSQAGIPGSRVGEKLDKMIVKGLELCGFGFFLFFPLKTLQQLEPGQSHGGELGPGFVTNLWNDPKWLLVSMEILLGSQHMFLTGIIPFFSWNSQLSAPSTWVEGRDRRISNWSMEFCSCSSKQTWLREIWGGLQAGEEMGSWSGLGWKGP